MTLPALTSVGLQPDDELLLAELEVSRHLVHRCRARLPSSTRAVKIIHDVLLLAGRRERWKDIYRWTSAEKTAACVAARAKLARQP